MTVWKQRPWLAWTLVGVGYAVLLAVMFWRVIARDQMAGWDSLEEYWPDLIYQARAYTDGELPLWNPYTLGGYAFYADPQASQLAPGNWICVLLSPLVGTGPLLMMVKILVLFYAAAWGTHLVLYRWTRCHAAAAIAAITFVAGGPVLVHKNGALLWPMLYLPWALLALDAYLARPTLRRGALLGFAVGATGAAGHPQGFFYALLVLVAYGLARVAAGAYAARRELKRALRTALVRHAASGVLALALAVLWLWAVYGPAGSVVEDSERGVRTFNWVMGNPLHPEALRELFAPNLDKNWAHDIYLGPLALVALAWLAVIRWHGRFWFAVAVIATLLALGSHTPLLPLLVENVPGFGLFRIPYRYKLITGFAGSVGAGLAVAQLMQHAPALRERLVLAALSLAWLACALLFGATLQTLYATLVLVALGLVAQDRPRRRIWAALLVLLVAFDLWRANDGKLAILQPVPDADKGMAILGKLDGLARDWRFWASDRWSSHPGQIPFATAYRHDLREISGFEQPLTPLRAVDLLARAKQTPRVLAHFNVRYYLQRNPGAGVPVPGTPVYKLTDVAPVVQVYPAAEQVPAKAQLERFAVNVPSGLHVALVDPADPLPPLPQSAFAPVAGRVLAFERNAMTVEVDAPAPGIAVINEVWSPEWQVTIDGEPAQLFRANYMLRGVVVPAGHHVIAMRFVATTYRIAVAALLALLVGFAILAAVRPRWWDRSYGPTTSVTDSSDAGSSTAPSTR